MDVQQGLSTKRRRQSPRAYDLSIRDRVTFDVRAIRFQNAMAGQVSSRYP
jgi:hypothetical protein